MKGTKIADVNADLGIILLERKRMEKEKHPDLDMGDFTILKNGPIAFKVAMHWVIRDRHTQKIHHHSVKIDTYRKLKEGWTWDEQHSITLENKDENEILQLMQFLHAILNIELPKDSGNYIIINTYNSQDDLGTLGDPSSINALLRSSLYNQRHLFKKLIEWFVKIDDQENVINGLEELNVNELQKINSLVGISRLKNAIKVWHDNQKNDDEEFWQKHLSENSFIFSQVFSYPVAVLKGKAYVGGKGIENTGGNIVDFLLANNLSQNTLLVEIKTPETKLLSGKYRGDIYNVSTELSGSVMQIANYRDSLVKEYEQLRNKSTVPFEAINPQSIVIIGNSNSISHDTSQKQSFELFRSSLKDVQIITYDELFHKVQILIDLLEGNTTT